MKFVDIFAGTGGIRLGFERALNSLGITHECVFASEIDRNACLSYALNFGENPYSDITTVAQVPPFDFMLAGFPCQAFSYAGKQRGFGDTRGTLFYNIERILDANRPKAFLLENVRGLTTHDNGRTLKTIIGRLEALGYGVKYLLLNSSNFGVPQNRVRIYIVGILGGSPNLSINSDVGPSDTHRFNQQFEQPDFFGTYRSDRRGLRVLGDVLVDQVDPKYHCSKIFAERLKSIIGNDLSKLNGYRLIDYRNGNSIHSWELGIKGSCTSEEREFMNLLIANRRKKIFGTHQDGKSLTRNQIETFYVRQDFEAVTSGLLQKGYLNLQDGRYKPVCGNMSFEVFKFLDPLTISITLTASDANRLGVVWNGVARRITPRECARIQGYPETYKLLDNDNAVYKQMGNGVSVPVIEAVINDFFQKNEQLCARPANPLGEQQ